MWLAADWQSGQAMGCTVCMSRQTRRLYTGLIILRLGRIGGSILLDGYIGMRSGTVVSATNQAGRGYRCLQLSRSQTPARRSQKVAALVALSWSMTLAGD